MGLGAGDSEDRCNESSRWTLDTETGEMAHTGHELGQHWESHCSAISDLGIHLWLQIHKIPCSFLAKMSFGARGLPFLKHGATNPIPASQECDCRLGKCGM